MTSQIRRSAASIAANVAEGHGRESTGAFIQFLRVAQGSLKELETHIILCGEVGLMAEAEVVNLLGQADEIGKNAAFDDQEPATEVMKSFFPYSLFTTRYSLIGAH